MPASAALQFEEPLTDPCKLRRAAGGVLEIELAVADFRRFIVLLLGDLGQTIIDLRRWFPHHFLHGLIILFCGAEAVDLQFANGQVEKRGRILGVQGRQLCQVANGGVIILERHLHFNPAEIDTVDLLRPGHGGLKQPQSFIKGGQ